MSSREIPRPDPAFALVETSLKATQRNAYIWLAQPI